MKNKFLFQTIFVFLIAISLFLPSLKSVRAYELPKPLTQEERDRIKRQAEENRRKYEGSATATPKPSPTATPKPSPSPTPKPTIEPSPIVTASTKVEEQKNIADQNVKEKESMQKRAKHFFFFILQFNNTGRFILFFINLLK